MDATNYFLKEKGDILCCFPTEMCCCIVSCCAPILDHSIIIKKYQFDEKYPWLESTLYFIKVEWIIISFHYPWWVSKVPCQSCSLLQICICATIENSDIRFYYNVLVATSYSCTGCKSRLNDKGKFMVLNII